MLILTSGENQPTVFEQTYRDYRGRLAGVDLSAVASILGLVHLEAEVEVPLLGRQYRVGPAGVTGPDGGRPAFAVCVILLQLLLRCPNRLPVGAKEWTAFRNFPDAAPLTGFFAERVEGALLRAFHQQFSQLAPACIRLPGGPEAGFPYDLAWRFQVLPHLPVLLLFNQADEELPAACSLLFQQQAGVLLDMECLAIIGELLVAALDRS